jgi:hypothetical protein
MCLRTGPVAGSYKREPSEIRVILGCCGVRLDTNVSDDRTASIFRVLFSPPWKLQISHEPSSYVNSRKFLD